MAAANPNIVPGTGKDPDQPPFSGFHAHIYFDAESAASAGALHLLIGERLAANLRYHGKLIQRPIGPHPVPMFELDFLPENFAKVVPFLMRNHGDHSVLIHPESGNDLADHTVHALWLGKKLELDLRKL